MTNLSDGDINEAAVLVNKTIKIVGGLRESLNLNIGGEIANNLDALYEYVISRLESIGRDEPVATLTEVKNLLNEVYLGWQEMDATPKTSNNVC